MSKKVLLFTVDMIPLSGLSTSGGGLRIWGIGEALRGRGHEVLYSLPKELLGDSPVSDEIRQLAFDPRDMSSTLAQVKPDVVIVEQWGLCRQLPELECPLVVDIHGPHLLEHAYRRHGSLTSNAATKLQALQRADLVLVPSRRQRAYLSSWMVLSGADPLQLPIEIVPVSMPPELPPREAAEDGPLSLVYGGQLWPWINSITALRTTCEVLAETKAGTLQLFVQKPHPSVLLPQDQEGQIRASRIDEDIWQSEVVAQEGFIPHEELLRRYRRAHLALDLYAHNMERELAFTTRTVEYLWSGVPVLHGDYSELAPLIERYQAGWLVSPEDPEAIRRTLRQIFADPEELRHRSVNAQRLIAEELAWNLTIGPLDQFVRQPAIRKKGRMIIGPLAYHLKALGAEAQQQIEQLEHQRQHLQDELARCEHQHGADIARLERRLSEKEQQQDNEQHRREQLTAHYEAICNELALMKNRTTAAEKQVASLKEDYLEAMSRIAAQKAELQEGARHQAYAQQDLQRRERTLQDELVLATSDLEQLQQRLGQQTLENERLARQAQIYQQELQALQERWLLKAANSSGHLYQRIAVQLPALAYLWGRHLARHAATKLQHKSPLWQRLFPAHRTR